MLTTFRCSFGDCGVHDGTPLIEHMSAVSVFWSYIFSGFLFLAVIGLFNVISAIFVESSLASAGNLQTQKKLRRLEDEEIWASNMVVMLKALDLGLIDDGQEGLDLEDDSSFMPHQADKLLSVHVPRSVLDKVI